MNFTALRNVSVLAAVCLLSMGTTYVVMEGDQEVGRYDEADGKDAVVQISADKPRPVPMKKETQLRYSQDQGYSAELVETGKMVPDRRKMRRVSGVVRDMITLKPVPGGTLIFNVDLSKIEVPVAWSGSFTASVPEPEKMAVTVSYLPPEGYHDLLWIFRTGELQRMKAIDRYRAALGVPLMSLGTRLGLGLELGVRPKALPSEEEIRARYGS